MPYKPFVPFRILSAYTMLEGAIDPKAMAKLAKERGFPAIAIADRNGLYGAVMFANACKAEGVQPIIGTLLGVARDSEGKQVDYLPLYAQDEAGYDNLCHLVSKAHLERPLEYDPHVAMDDLAGYTDGLIAFTGASEGAVTRLLAEGQQSHAEAALDRLQALFPERLYIELARRGNAVEERYDQKRGLKPGRRLGCQATVQGDIVIDAKSGISGAGKTPSGRTHFSECHGSVAAYGLFEHRHGAEIEQELEQAVTFTPHLVPLDRGILETIYGRVRRAVSETMVATALEQAYADAPFVRLTGDALPEIKHVTHTNFCDIGWKIDTLSRRLVLVVCLDNLVKGAAGQALQNLNVAFGLDETTGLS